ncbi:Centromere protein F [Galemys pyrenaicus]|uniref:Centromere protein F n=1 Tax=Galemys pyrenaicus TaxID=202257 RepID=A0A8J5ZSH9_GALPY|nr:Centromere protein F [Galemys pyrenaicus]
MGVTGRSVLQELTEEGGLARGQSEQRAREAGRLEEELRAAREALSQSQRSAEEMRVKNVSQEAALRDLREKISQQESASLEKLTRAVADLEKQRDCSQDLLKKREHHIEQLNEKLSRTERESWAMLSALELKSQECEELSQEKAQLSRCQSENGQRLHQAQAEQESLQRRISHLETRLQEQQVTGRECSERLAALELERGQLGAEVGRLQAALDSKVAEVGAHQRAHAALQQQAEASDRQHREEMENMRWQVAQLARRVADREQELQALAGEIADRDQRCRDLSAECERLRGRACSGGFLLGASAARDGRPALEQPSATEGPLADIVGEQERRDAARSPLGPALSQSKVIALERTLEPQKQVNSELQKQCAELARKREEAEENLSRAERVLQEFVAETSQRIRELQEDTCVHQKAAAQTPGALEDKGEELQLLTEQLKAQRTESEDLRGRNRLLGASLEELRLVSGILSEMDSIISLQKEEIQALTHENGTLKEVNASLSQERLDLFQKSEGLSLCIDEKEKSISQLSSQYEQERLTLLQRCEETGRALEELSEKYKAGQEKSSQLECLLSECTRICEDRKVELEQLKETFAREHQACVAKLALAEERNQRLELELDAAHPRAADPPSCSQSEAEALKREVMALKEEQSEMQKEVLALSRENAQLRERVQSQWERPDPERPAGEPADAAPRTGLAVKGASPEGRGARQAHLEAKVSGPELRFRESELLPPETSGHPDCDVDAEGACEWAACGDGSAALEAECGALRAACSVATGEMAAEVEGLVGEVRPLDCERSLLHSELLTEEAEDAVGAQLPSPNPPDDRSFGERLAASREAVHAHLAELRAWFSLQSEHRASHEQRCRLSPRVAVLQACVDGAEAEELALCMDLRDTQGDLEKGVPPRPPEGQPLLASLSGGCDSPRPAGVRASPCKALPELAVGTSLLSRSDGDTTANQSPAEDASSGSLGEEALAPGGPPPPPGGRVAELEALCQAYLRSLGRLEEEVERQGLLRAREVQELRQLLRAEREAREGLRRQHLSEREQWQQRLASVTAEMESELAAERKQTEHLSLELELARLQLQGLDLGSRSLLGADLEGAARESESCDAQEPEGSTAASPRARGPGEDQQDLSPEPGALGLPGHGPGGCTPAGSPEPSPSGPGAPALVDFLGGQPTTEDLQAQVQEASRENVRLLQAIAERDRRVQGLLGEVEELGSKLESQAVQLAAKSAACLELGRVVEQLRKEKPDLSDARAAPASDGWGSGQGLQRWGGLGPGPHSGAQRGSHAASGEGSVAVGQERGSVGAQKAGLECWVFSLGADLARVPAAEKWSLEEDDAGRPAVTARPEQELSTPARGGQGPESEGRGDPGLTPVGVEDSAPGAPGPRPDSAQGLSPPPRTLSLQGTELPGEEAPLSEQLRAVDGNTRLGQLARERERLAGEAERLQAQLGQSDAERLRVSRALEAALLEKAEVAARLSSTQGEAQQLRRGIEALRVRIEADERARRRVSEQLRDSERRADGLQDRVERLERELQAAEDGQELLIVEAEAAKAEADTLRAQAQEAAGRLRAVQEDLAALRADRQSLEQQLQRERGRVSEADAALSSLRRVLEDKERESVRAAEESAAALEALRAQLAELQAEVAALCRELDTPGAGAQGPASPDARPPSAPGIEQLRGRLQAGAGRLLRVSGQLQESERQADRLRGQVVDLQEELEAAGQSHRQAAGEAETLRAKLEEMALGLHALESELVSGEGEKEELRHELQEARGRVSALTAQNASLEDLLQEKEQEKEQMKEESRAAVDTLQAQLKELREEVAASNHELEAQRGREQDLGLRADALELEKTQLQQGLEEAERGRAALQSSVSGLLEEVGDSKRKLAQKEEEVRLLEAQLQDHQQLVSELSRAEAEQLRWREREREREQEAQELQARSHALQDSLDALRAAHQDLERELEEAKVENATLVGKVNTLALAETELQREVRELEQKAVALKEEFSGEKSRLAGELELKSEEIKSSDVSGPRADPALQPSLPFRRPCASGPGPRSRILPFSRGAASPSLPGARPATQCPVRTGVVTVGVALDGVGCGLSPSPQTPHSGQRQRLLRENGDLKQRLESEHKARLESQGRAAEEAAAWERRLHGAERTYQALRDAHAQSQVEIQAAREKLASSEERLGAQQAELGLLRSREEELSRTLAAAQRLADERETAKADSLRHAEQLRKENERAQGKMKLLIKSCRQLEEEKEALQKELAKRSAAQEGPAAGAAVDAGVAEVKELKETLEAKSKEADAYLDKYCALLISHEKLEKAKEMLESQLCLLRPQRAGRQPRSPAPGSALEPSPAPPAMETRSSSGSGRASGKRPRASGLQESRGPSTPSTPETFSKKSRRAVHSGPQSPEDTFEPEGLPEVVKKGFADIPTGKSSPHVLRRTTLATRTSPRLAAQKLAAAPLGLNKENQAEPCRPRAGGSRPQKPGRHPLRLAGAGAVLAGAGHGCAGAAEHLRRWPLPEPCRTQHAPCVRREDPGCGLSWRRGTAVARLAEKTLGVSSPAAALAAGVRLLLSGAERRGRPDGCCVTGAGGRRKPLGARCGPAGRSRQPPAGPEGQARPAGHPPRSWPRGPWRRELQSPVGRAWQRGLLHVGTAAPARSHRGLAWTPQWRRGAASPRQAALQGENFGGRVTWRSHGAGEPARHRPALGAPGSLPDCAHVSVRARGMSSHRGGGGPGRLRPQRVAEPPPFRSPCSSLASHSGALCRLKYGVSNKNLCALGRFLTYMLHRRRRLSRVCSPCSGEHLVSLCAEPGEGGPGPGPGPGAGKAGEGPAGGGASGLLGRQVCGHTVSPADAETAGCILLGTLQTTADRRRARGLPRRAASTAHGPAASDHVWGLGVRLPSHQAVAGRTGSQAKLLPSRAAAHGLCEARPVSAAGWEGGLLTPQKDTRSVRALGHCSTAVPPSPLL